MANATVAVPHRSSAYETLITRLEHSFYFLVSLVIATVVAYGFSHTISQNLLFPSIPRPSILYVHAAVSFAWIGLFVAQSALVRTRNVRIHRRLGWIGAAIGALIPVVGIGTAFTMANFNVLHGLFGSEDSAAFLIIPINDMLCFTTSFVLAVLWRRWPEYHRRLMFIATCCLTAAAFARLPFITVDALRWYGGVDALILLGVARDLAVTRRVHTVYLYGLPLLILAQVVTMTLFLERVPAWMHVARALLQE